MRDKITLQLSEISALLKRAGIHQRMMADELILLRRENEQLKKSKVVLEQKTGQLEELIFILKSSISPLDDQSKKDFEKRLNKYLLTINKCIGLLKT